MNRYILNSIEIYETKDVIKDYQSVLIVLRHEGKFVLAKNKKRCGLELPGGHKDNDETIEETARRESLEEVGANIKNIEIIGYYILPTGHKTIITKAEVQSFVQLTGEFETESVELFESIPEDKLTFKDGLYSFIANNML